MQHKMITFIGAGHMASALMRGLTAAEYPGHCITVHDISVDKAQALAENLGLEHQADLALAVAKAEIIVLAVKPNGIATVCQALKAAIAHKPLIISVAAGVKLSSIERFLGQGPLPMVRSMPNTPALIGCGATGLYANAKVDASLRNWSESLFRSVGIVQWFEQEKLLDSVTALSGSGPAYIFLVMEAMQEAGIALGLDPQLAKTFTIQTVLGASRIALETAHPISELREQVTSPGGTTEKALSILNQGQLKDLFLKALQSAYDQAQLLSATYDKE